jgi:hypothetical protein
MAVRWYLIAMDQVDNRRAPKYVKSRLNPTGLAVPWGMMDYGLMNVAVMWANVTTAQHNSLVANADCKFAATAANLDNAIGAPAATNARAVLEALQIPGSWVQGTDTWRQILRGTCGLFLFAQRLHGKFNVELVPAGYTLDTTFGELPAAGRQFLLDTADELGIDRTGATASVTLRQIYRAFGNAWGTKPILIGGVTL